MFGNQGNKRPEITTKYSLVNHYKWKLIIFFDRTVEITIFSPFSVDYCNPNPCKNRGVCVVEEGKGYSCTCEPGFTGFHCQGNSELWINI